MHRCVPSLRHVNLAASKSREVYMLGRTRAAEVAAYTQGRLLRKILHPESVPPNSQHVALDVS